LARPKQNEPLRACGHVASEQYCDLSDPRARVVVGGISPWRRRLRAIIHWFLGLGRPVTGEPPDRGPKAKRARKPEGRCRRERERCCRRARGLRAARPRLEGSKPIQSAAVKARRKRGPNSIIISRARHASRCLPSLHWLPRHAACHGGGGERRFQTPRPTTSLEHRHGVRHTKGGVNADFTMESKSINYHIIYHLFLMWRCI
jgi:hypothetical protein